MVETRKESYSHSHLTHIFSISFAHSLSINLNHISLSYFFVGMEKKYRQILMLLEGGGEIEIFGGEGRDPLSWIILELPALVEITANGPLQ